MKAIIIILLFCAISTNLFPHDLPSKSDIVNTMKKVNDKWMADNPETETINSSAADWLEGTYFAGHLAFFELFPQKENINHAYFWGKNNDWNLGVKPKEADNQCVGQAYMDIFIANGSKDDFMLSKIDNSVQNLVNRSSSDDWHWIDALFMAMPVLTRYGNYFNRDSYLDKLFSLFHHTKVTLQLYDEADGLWFRDAKFKPPFETPGGKKCYWSRGNGWVFAGLTSTLKYLPEDNNHRQEYIEVFKSMAQALQKVQRNDGFWNVSLADTTDFPGPETSGTAFFTYGIAWGINEGILDSAFYMPTVIKAWNGMVSKAVHPDGKVGYVQGVADKPSRSQPVTYDSFRDYGDGGLLLAGTEVVKLAPGEMPLPNDFYVKSVEFAEPNVLKVTFYEEAEKSSAENISNYIINKGVEVLKAEISDDKLSSLLTLSNISDDYYGIYFQNILSMSGKIIGPGNGKQFKGVKSGEVVLEYETKISDYGLYFDGDRVSPATVSARMAHPNRTDGKYDYAFGPRITPHGDCIAKHGDYLFVTWYRGGKEDRHVMLTRINLVTKSRVTIEFPHIHTGYHGRWWVGESHNTIAVGICPKDETIHLLYDMHGYTRTSQGGVHSDDYFRYSVSVKNAATLPDNEFTIDKFHPKRLYLKQGENYEGKTYPEFFVSSVGNLIVKMREGGSSNGKFQIAIYDGDEWSSWIDYNVKDAKSNHGFEYNWGLYGSFKYLNGKLQIGYSIRKNINDDKWVHNNGQFYSYSNHPDGRNDWYDYKGQQVPTPLIDPYSVFIAEPGDHVPGSGANSVTIGSGPLWTVTQRGDIHFLNNNVRGGGQNKNVHTFKSASDSDFTVSTNVANGDELISIGNYVYLIGLTNGRPSIRRAAGGTNNWSVVYQATSGMTFRHGNVLVADGKIYYYLMQTGSGTAQPLYLQVYDLALDIIDPDPVDPDPIDPDPVDPDPGYSINHREVLFYDSFNQVPVTPVVSSGDPAVDYTVWTTVTDLEMGGGTALIDEYAPGDGMIKLLARQSTEQSGNRTEVSAPLSAYKVPFNPVLSANTDTLEWLFTAKQNRSSTGGTSGFNGTNTGMAVVLASDSSVWGSQQKSNAKGYAITYLKPDTDNYCVSLSRFDGELSNYTVLVGNQLKDIFTDRRNWVTVRVTYIPAINEWNLFFRDEESLTEKGDVFNSEGMRWIGSVVDDTFTDMEMTHFGFALNTPAPRAGGANANAFMVDDFVVSLLGEEEDDDDDQRFTLSTKVVGGTGGDIIISPDQEDYLLDSMVELTAIPDDGYEFVSWSGDVTSTANPFSVIMDSHKEINANFNWITNSIQASELVFTVSPNPSDGIFSVQVMQPVSYKVFNLNGVLVKEGNSSETFYLDLSGYRSAPYILQLETQDGVRVQRIMKISK